MKIKKEIFAIMNDKGCFLRRYSDSKNSNNWSVDIEYAITVPMEFYGKVGLIYEQIANMVGGQLVKIEIEYRVKTLDGEAIGGLD